LSRNSYKIPSVAQDQARLPPAVSKRKLMATPQRTGQFHVPCHEHHVEMRLTDIVPQTIALDRAQFFCPLILPDTQQ